MPSPSPAWLVSWRDSARDITTLSAAAGSVGATYGGLLAVFRGHSVPLYSVSMGANFFLLAAAISGAEKITSVLVRRSDALTYGIGGALGGGFLSGVHAGPRGVVVGSLVFGLSSAGARTSVDLVLASDFVKNLSV